MATTSKTGTVKVETRTDLGLCVVSEYTNAKFVVDGHLTIFDSDNKVTAVHINFDRVSVE